MRFVQIEKLMNLVDGYKKLVRTGAGDFLFIYENGQGYLIRNECPHRGLPLDDSSVENGVLRCRHHGLCFDLVSGKCIDQPGSCSSLQHITLAYEGQHVGFIVEE